MLSKAQPRITLRSHGRHLEGAKGGMSSKNERETRGVTGCLSCYYHHPLTLCWGFSSLSITYKRAKGLAPKPGALSLRNNILPVLSRLLNVRSACCGRASVQTFGQRPRATHHTLTSPKNLECHRTTPLILS